MVDTADTILLVRLQATGGNVNLWGGYLNTALSTLTRASKGYQAYTVNGDATITWANYSATNDFAVANVKMNAGTVLAAFTLTVPNYNQDFTTTNNTLYAGTAKVSGGTGIAVPAGRRAKLYVDGTDVEDGAANWLSDYAGTLVNAGDIVVKDTLESAIANAALPATAGTVLVSAADTTAGYVGTKVSVVGSGAATVTPSTTNPGANEVKVFTVTVGDGGLTAGGLQLASFAAVVGTAYTCPVGGTITLPAATGSRRKIALTIYGAGVTTLSGTVNGLTSYPVDGDQTIYITDSDSTRGWV